MNRGTLGTMLALMVMGASVDIEFAGGTFRLGPGATRAFGEPEGNAASGIVVSSAEGRLTLDTGSGTRTFVVPEAPNKEWPQLTKLEQSRQLARIAVAKALRPGMKVQVRISGENSLDGVSASGTVEGTVASRVSSGVLLLAVEGVEGPMRFVANWEKAPEGDWRPVPGEVERFNALATGTRIRVTYELEEHLRVKHLTVVSPKEKRE